MRRRCNGAQARHRSCGIRRITRPSRAASWVQVGGSVGERSQASEAAGQPSGGRLRSENAGVSNERGVRIPSTDCPRFPEQRSSAQGQSGPKARPRGVADGRLVDIPVPPHPRPARIRGTKGTPSGATDQLGTREAKGGRRRVGRPTRWSSWGKCVGGFPRQIRGAITLRHDAEPLQAKRSIPCCREKPLASG